ncbi:hypothetical protein DFH27DRAFT_528775 [Peziza echinospora]|nr:hypothetical protein DFH27DRAFT_528775 [Peziza echinospora]
MSWLFGGCCGGGYRRRKRWALANEQAVLIISRVERARSTSPFQPKMARFYGVQPLFPDPPAAVRAHSPLTFDSGSHNSDSSRSWTPDSGISRDRVGGGEKLERWLGENLRTIPEDGQLDNDRFELDGRELHRRTWFLPDDHTSEESEVPWSSSSGKESVFVSVHGGNDGGSGTNSDCSGEEEWDEDRYAGFMSIRKYTPTFLLDETCYNGSERVGSIMTSTSHTHSRARESTDCSTIATTRSASENGSWIVQPLGAAPRYVHPKACAFEIYEDISREAPRPGSTGTIATNVESISYIRSPGTSISEFGFEKRSLKKKSSAGSFKFSRLKSQGGSSYASSWRRPASSNRSSDLHTTHPHPDLPGPTAQIPWRTVSIRAVRRQFQELPQEQIRRSVLDELRGAIPPTPIPAPPQTQQQPPSASPPPDCQCDEHAPAADATRVHNWVSGQQQQYHSSSTDSLSSSSPSTPLPSTRPDSEVLTLHPPVASSRYPITETSGRTMTLRSMDSSSGSASISGASTALGYTPSFGYHPRHHHHQHHHHHSETCPCYAYNFDELASMPVHQEVDPIASPGFA